MILTPTEQQCSLQPVSHLMVSAVQRSLTKSRSPQTESISSLSTCYMYPPGNRNQISHRSHAVAKHLQSNIEPIPCCYKHTASSSSPTDLPRSTCSSGILPPNPYQSLSSANEYNTKAPELKPYSYSARMSLPPSPRRTSIQRYPNEISRLRTDFIRLPQNLLIVIIVSLGHAPPPGAA